jgi:hypothetical protein
MSFSRLVFPAIKPLSVLSIALAAAVIGGCNERDVEPRAERGVVAKVFSLDSAKRTEWKRPGVTLEKVEAHGLPQVDITTCDYDYQSWDNRIHENEEDDAKSFVPGPDIDSVCFVTVGNDDPSDDCIISYGQSRYEAMLGGFEINLINGSTRKTQHMAIDGIGFNVVIKDAGGGVVWDMVADNLDYLDLVAESANLLAADGGDACPGNIKVANGSSDSFSGLRYFGVLGAPYLYALSPANSEDFYHRVYWNGKDSEGNDVPAGTYTAHIDITVTDTDTGDTWESPAPIEFTIADADPETE